MQVLLRLQVFFRVAHALMQGLPAVDETSGISRRGQKAVVDAHRAESGKKVKGKKAGLRKYPAIRSASYASVIIPHACLLQGKACKSKKRSKGKACKAKGLRRLRAISMASIPSSHEDELPANPDPSHLPKAKAKGAKKRKANTEVAEDTPAPVTKAPKRAPGKPKAGKGFEEPLATKSKPGKGKGKAGKKAAEKDNAKTGTGDGKKKRGEARLQSMQPLRRLRRRPQQRKAASLQSPRRKQQSQGKQPAPKPRISHPSHPTRSLCRVSHPYLRSVASWTTRIPDWTFTSSGLAS